MMAEVSRRICAEQSAFFRGAIQCVDIDRAGILIPPDAEPRQRLAGLGTRDQRADAEAARVSNLAAGVQFKPEARRYDEATDLFDIACTLGPAVRLLHPVSKHEMPPANAPSGYCAGRNQIVASPPAAYVMSSAPRP